MSAADTEQRAARSAGVSKRWPLAFLAAALVVSLSSCLASRGGDPPVPSAAGPGGAGKAVPLDIAHIVVVVEENHSFADIIGNPEAPYLNRIAAEGALLTRAYGVEHPSQPNYLDLFSGGDQGVFNDGCPHNFRTPNLGRSLLDAQLSFVGYSEDLPHAGYSGCTFGSSDGYWRKHGPWVNFSNLPASVNQPMTAFPSDYAKLPTVSFVIPNQANDMHNGTIAQADRWLEEHIGPYLTWASAHRSILIVTWDESEGSAGNHIPLIVAGAGVVPGRCDEVVNHYSVLRTIEEIYGLPFIGHSAEVAPITGIWALE